MRVRCKHCGFVRAKNTTRQVEHLLQCPDFLSSADGQAAIAETTFTPVLSASAGPNLPSEIWRGKAPNPNISVQKRGPGRPRHSGVAASTPLQTHAPSRPQPSLTTHLLTRDPAAFAAATRQPFLSHAGCGTLALTPLLHWLAQDSYVSRAFLAFIGTLIGKIRLPEAKNSQQNSAYRAADLLISAANNVRREIGFFEVTVQKYGLQIGGEDAKPPTKAYLDLLANASSPAASLLEGLVVLWATEHVCHDRLSALPWSKCRADPSSQCYRTSWHYASTFTSTMSQSRSNYSLPSYLTDSQPGAGNPYGGAPGGGGEASDNSHVNALHDALIPNWTSAPFDKFVDACRAIVDELANAQTTGNGIEEMRRCESVFRQVVWLWERIWPRVDGMGEEDELAFDGGGGGGVRQPSRPGGPASNANGKGRATADHPRANGPGGQTDEDPVEIQDDEQRPAEQDAPGDEDSPYGGTGLDAVQAANEAS